MAKAKKAQEKSDKRNRNLTWWFFGISIAALTLSFLLDDACFAFVELIKNPVLDFLMGAIMSFWSVISAALFLTVILYAVKQHRYAPWMWLSIVVSWVLCYCLKFAFNRPRPEDILISLPLIGANDTSFPSGHATTAAAMVPAMGKALPALTWLWICIAAVFAFSRVYLGVHHLSDVVAGFVLGFAVGELMLALKAKWEQRKTHAKARR